MNRKAYRELIRPLFSKITTSKGTGTYLEAIEKEPRPLVLLFAANLCVGEIQNGGFLQFLYNPTGMVVPEAIEGLRAMELHELAMLVETATAPLGNPYPRNREDRQEALLRAPGLSVDEIAEIAKNSADAFVGFRKATETLNYDELSKKFWQLARSENSGFSECANRFATSFLQNQS